MIVLPSSPCEGRFGVTRRDLLRVGGSSVLGLSLGAMFQAQARAAEAPRARGRGWGKAKSIIMCYLQGGPSHIDLWDPKEDEKVRSIFAPIPTKVPGVQFTEILPRLA